MLTLVIGNQNYSSWSLRPWLAMTETGIPFRVHKLALDTPGFAAAIARFSPVGRVPVLLDDEVRLDGAPLAVWDTLAIAEHLVERYPDRGLWPTPPAWRARARSICAEMHAGFGALRAALPMNVTAHLPGHGWSVRVQDDVERLVAMWRDCLERSGGPLLFGTFTHADAFFAPVVSRFATYAIALPADIAAYRDRVLALAAMRAWTAAAAEETDFLAVDEPYRRAATTRPAP